MSRARRPILRAIRYIFVAAGLATIFSVTGWASHLMLPGFIGWLFAGAVWAIGVVEFLEAILKSLGQELVWQDAGQ